MAFQRKKQKKELMPWRQNLPHHQHIHKPTKADRGEFPRQVVERLKREANGRCQACRERPDTETHHVVPKGGRAGRGVFTNGLRVCRSCHHRIQTNEDELQYWIAEYERRYGACFWFDEQDWDERSQKELKARTEEIQRSERMNQIAPVVNVLSALAGRKLKGSEIRAVESWIGTGYLPVMSKLADEIEQNLSARKAVGYGERFED